MRLSFAIAAVVAVGLAILAVVVLRDRTAASAEATVDAEVDEASRGTSGSLKPGRVTDRRGPAAHRCAAAVDHQTMAHPGG